MKLLSVLVFTFLFVSLPSAYAIDFDQYRISDLDQLLAAPKIRSGIKMVVPQQLQFRAVLAAPVQNCNTDILKRTMVMQGNKKEVVEKMALTKCLNIRSAKRASTSVFIEDKVAERLSREVKPGEVLELFCSYLYISPAGPTLLVNGFKKLK
ncbi:MAG: hypothetical protein KJ630_20880 [Proteobacteria bacterium]|nr:hypothetical protein [Pseudomonadota bacterium]